MLAEDIKKILSTAIEDSIVIVNTNDNVHFDAIVISNQFLDLSLVKRQQMVYAAVNKEITSGQIHALSLKTYTSSEWENAQA